MFRKLLMLAAVVYGMVAASVAFSQSMNLYRTEVQWGGRDKPWRPNGEFVLGGRDKQRLEAIRVESRDGGQTLNGEIQYTQEGPIEFRAINVGGNTYSTEVQWGGPTEPWHRDNHFILGGRDQQRLWRIHAVSRDGGMTFDGTMQYAEEGPIGFRAKYLR